MSCKRDFFETDVRIYAIDQMHSQNNIKWMCKLYEKFEMFDSECKKLLIVGISGVTCGGKTTIATQLHNALPKSTLFTQDTYFRDVDDPMHTWVPELNHINFDIISSLNMDKMMEDVLKFIEDNNFTKIPSKKTETFTSNLQLSDKNLQDKIKNHIHVIIIEGFTIFNYKKWLYLFSLKYFFTLNKEDCYKRRIKRVYEPPDCPGYFEKVVWPEYEKNKKEVEESVEDVRYFQNIPLNFVDTIFKDISEYVDNIL